MLVFIAGMLVAFSFPVIWKKTLIEIYRTQYVELVLLCDGSMREHRIAKQRALNRPDPTTLAVYAASEIALLDCQDYDLFRKKLILYGLDENELSLMSLQAIEARSTDLFDVVNIHEIE